MDLCSPPPFGEYKQSALHTALKVAPDLWSRLRNVDSDKEAAMLQVRLGSLPHVDACFFSMPALFMFVTMYLCIRVAHTRKVLFEFVPPPCTFVPHATHVHRTSLMCTTSLPTTLPACRVGRSIILQASDLLQQTMGALRSHQVQQQKLYRHGTVLVNAAAMPSSQWTSSVCMSWKTRFSSSWIQCVPTCNHMYVKNQACNSTNLELRIMS